MGVCLLSDDGAGESLEVVVEELGDGAPLRPDPIALACPKLILRGWSLVRRLK